MKRNRSRSVNNDGSSPKRPRTDAMDEQRYFFQFQDGQLVDAGAAMDVGLVCDLDAIHRLAQQTFPVGHVTISLDQAAILNAGLAPAAAAESRSSAPSSPIAPLCAEDGLAGLLVCQPVAATLLAALPFKDWIRLRGVARCWRDAVDLQLRSLKEFNVCAILDHKGGKTGVNEEKKAKSLMKFISGKAPGVEVLVVGKLIAAFPKVLKRLEKLKRVDMGGAKLTPKLLDVLEKVTTMESWEAVTMPSEPHDDLRDSGFKQTFKARLQVQIGRLVSLQSLSFSTFSQHSALLRGLKNPEKLTTLSINKDRPCPVRTLQGLAKFINLQNLEVICPKHFERASVLKVLKLTEWLTKSLRCLDLGDSTLFKSFVQTLTELPLLERLTATSGFLPEDAPWAQFKQLSCLELGKVKETFIPCLNQIATLTCLKLGGKLKFTCSLPQLHTLCLDRGSSFLLDLHPTCSNLKTLTLYTVHYSLMYLAPGLLNRNPYLKTLRIGWTMTGGQSLRMKSKMIAKACQSLETLEFAHCSKVEKVEGLLEVAGVFVDRCPGLKNLRVAEAYVDALKAKKKFKDLNISICSPSKDSWLFE